uniref:Uncharacterized protein n=1 Tax=Paramoeba aestuarina TaxID=180227 RepID=A0A7S4L9I9_9EUKA|mmetsp:Transcript_33922/g.53080  ORF Transcript_33922/g.53080 Transcript_33922/m.53080 type:complete len:138 (+) Transcript_33922:150-563(+)
MSCSFVVFDTVQSTIFMVPQKDFYTRFENGRLKFHAKDERIVDHNVVSSHYTIRKDTVRFFSDPEKAMKHYLEVGAVRTAEQEAVAEERRQKEKEEAKKHAEKRAAERAAAKATKEAAKPKPAVGTPQTVCLLNHIS